MSKEHTGKLPYTADMLIMLVACAVIACFHNGLAALRLILICTAASTVCDAAGTLILKKEICLKDLSAVVTGMCAALALPAGCPAGIAVLASVVSVAVGKLPFGDHDKAPFVPAAVGIAFVTLLYPTYIFDYSVSADASYVTGMSLASMLRSGNSVNITGPALLNILAGNCPGPIGATCTFFFAACLVYLAVRKTDKFFIAAGFTAVCALFSVLFPRVLSGRHVSLLMELGGGMLLYAAVFLMTYPNVRFRSFPVCLVYGGLGGVLCMLIRYFGSHEEGVCFAVLIMNALSPVFEKKEAASALLSESGGTADE